MIKRLHIAMLSVLLAGVQVHGQEWRRCPADEVEQARRAADSLYRSLWGFQMVVEFRSYRSKEDHTPFDRESANIRREGERFRSEFGGSLTVQDQRLRVVTDRETRTLTLADPVDLQSVFAEMFARELSAAATSCWVRKTAQGTEYRMIFHNGAIDRVEIRFDAAGWPLRTETVWRIALRSAPGESGPSAAIPRMEVDYGRPQPIKKGSYSEITDPGRLVAVDADGEARGQGEWARFEVNNVRLNRP